MARLIPVLSLFMFALVGYGVGVFAAWLIHPAAWPDWLRLIVAAGAVAGWVWDMRRHVDS